MTKELQDHVWSVLPKEFKEEVKRMWNVEVDCATKYHSELHKHRTGLLYELFGDNLHWQNNLTSDAEGEEEMLCCEDYEPKPAEPKFKEGDRAIYCIPEKQRIKARVVNVRQRSGSTLFNTLFNYDIRLDDGRTANWVDEQWLLPDNDDQVRAVTKKASERFDTIVKGGFRNERRLNIAAMAMQGILSNADRMKKYEYVATEPPYAELEVVVARKALRYADTLIAECEKGGEEE